jgi:hypothetical protein
MYSSSINLDRNYMENCGQLHAPAVLPPQKSPRSHWVGDLVGIKANLNTMENRVMFSLGGNRTSTVRSSSS